MCAQYLSEFYCVYLVACGGVVPRRAAPHRPVLVHGRCGWGFVQQGALWLEDESKFQNGGQTGRPCGGRT